MALPSQDAPPFGLGLAPRHDRLVRLRDRLVRSLALGALERMIASRMNPLRERIGLAPVRTINDVHLAASIVLALHRRAVRVPPLRLAGQGAAGRAGLWEPPADRPAWLDQIEGQLVLVTCSTLFQNDRPIVEAACEAFAGEPLQAVVTTADVDPGGIEAPPNVRIERFVAHTPIIERAACVVCHAGMGIAQKALAHGVPVVAVPFGRDQPEVARRVEVAGAGVRLPLRKLDADRLRGAVHRAIGLRPGAERVARAFAESGGPAAAADVLEKLATEAASPSP